MAFDLGSLLADVSKIDTGRTLTKVSIDDIYPDPENFYTMDNESIRELANSIQTVGLMDPITVRKHPTIEGGYMVISGHRRRAALYMLADEDKSYKQVEVFVDNSTDDPDMIRLKLIFGNSCTRRLSPWELSQQASEVERLLYSLSNKGVEFKGRMRDHVAKVCEISTGKLARLKVIEKGLIPEMMDKFRENKLNESAAYSLARLSQEDQKLIVNSKHAGGGFLNQSGIDDMAKRLEKVRTFTCDKTGGKCQNIEAMRNKIAQTSQYATTWCDHAGCCRNCDNMKQCGAVCEHAKQLKRDALAEDKRIKQEREESIRKREEPVVDFIRMSYRILLERMKQTGTSIETLQRDMHVFPNRTDLARWQECASGNKEISTSQMLAYGYSCHAGELMTLNAAAICLDCSTDYLLGRTPDPAPMRWHLGTPHEEGEYFAKVNWGSGKLCNETIIFKDGGWMMDGEKLADVAEVRAWMKAPAYKED